MVNGREIGFQNWWPEQNMDANIGEGNRMWIQKLVNPHSVPVTNIGIQFVFRSPILESTFCSGHRFWKPISLPVTSFGSQFIFRLPFFESHFLFRSPILKGGVWSRISQILELKDKYSLPRYATYHTFISNQNCIL